MAALGLGIGTRVFLLGLGLVVVACAGGGTSAPESPPAEPASIESGGAEDAGDDGTSDRTESEPIASDLEAAAGQVEDIDLPPPEAVEPDESVVIVSDPDEDLVVIDDGTEEEAASSVTLAEAARAERERRRSTPPSEIVITDQNLSEYATGRLTVAEVSSVAEGETDSGDAEAAQELDEQYWRSGARRIRQAWRDAEDRVGELEAEVFELRQRFYAEDDGFYRDSQIKPAWDLAIEQLDAARQEVADRQQELADFLERGRQAGALPGWLREGIELEPVLNPDTESAYEPVEPAIYEPQESADPP